MGYRYRNMYYLTGLPGWMLFGYSPGWIGRSPTGLPPTAQWLMQSGLLPQFTEWLRTQAPQPAATLPVTPLAPFVPAYTKEQEKQLLEQQVKILESQLEAIQKRLDELSKE